MLKDSVYGTEKTRLDTLKYNEKNLLQALKKKHGSRPIGTSY